MKFSELRPWFLKLDGDTWCKVATPGEADGVQFDCPKCRQHSVLCWRPEVPQNVLPNPGRWHIDGTGPQDLTLRAGPGAQSGSIKVNGACEAHFFVENGNVRLVL